MSLQPASPYEWMRHRQRHAYPTPRKRRVSYACVRVGQAEPGAGPKARGKAIHVASTGDLMQWVRV